MVEEVAETLSALLDASPAPATQSRGASWERPAGDLQVAGRVRVQDSIEGLQRLIIEKTGGNPRIIQAYHGDADAGDNWCALPFAGQARQRARRLRSGR
jgi:hypothetical protein